MLNTPNEWHNEEDIEEYTDDDFSDDYSGDYGEDGDFGTLDDADFEDSEYEEDAEENESGGGDSGSGEDDSKKKIIIGAAIILILLLLVGGIVGLSKKKVQKAGTAVETVVEGESSEGESEIEITEETGDEVDITIEDENAVAVEGNENAEEVGIAIEESETQNIADSGEAGGLEVEIDEASSTFADKPNDTENVTVSIGDVGRKNPFARVGASGTQVSSEHKTNNDGLDFEVIEPPELAPEDEMITRLLETKVSGIMYDARRPSAIINIDGVDQLVRIGDILGGFEFMSITKNKVVIRSDNNIYRASVGQPLNAEKITNPIEISNLETKFKGSKGR